MKALGSALAAVFLILSVAGAQAESPPTHSLRAFSEKQLAQQQRMTDCSAEAKATALRGDARKAFMQSCLSGGSVTVDVSGETASVHSANERRQKLKACGDEARDQALVGDARQAFMTACLPE